MNTGRAAPFGSRARLRRGCGCPPAGGAGRGRPVLSASWTRRATVRAAVASAPVARGPRVPCPRPRPRSGFCSFALIVAVPVGVGGIWLCPHWTCEMRNAATSHTGCFDIPCWPVVTPASARGGRGDRRRPPWPRPLPPACPATSLRSRVPCTPPCRALRRPVSRLGLVWGAAAVPGSRPHRGKPPRGASPPRRGLTALRSGWRERPWAGGSVRSNLDALGTPPGRHAPAPTGTRWPAPLRSSGDPLRTPRALPEWVSPL